MRSLYLLIMIYISLSLSGCATTTSSCTPPYTKNAKNARVALNETKNQTKPLAYEINPLTVAMYTEGQKPAASYKILGTETISKFNLSGIKRQTASIHDTMRNLAAKMGGDAIINIAHDDTTVTGTVIRYVDNEQKSAA